MEVLGDFAPFLAIMFGRKIVMSISFIGAGIFCLTSMLTNLYADGRDSKFVSKCVYDVHMQDVKKKVYDLRQ